ncbi:hypothetical protein [Oligoflexus tunisiensis]|uniref:hypothetical protein n=1 Tax=Oligoflexus tunisiensis TaxID=708132 RepID=UPI00114C8B0B|nr:hypothetical protein [Oligoflexus tunisiensis]
MLFPKLPIAVMCLVVVSTCSKKAKNQTQGEYVAAVLSADAVPVKPLLPTKPDGGIVEGKLQTLDPEEAERRRNKNIVEPIVFGTSVAGITMNTSYSEAMNTLVYYGSNQGIDFFQEHIVVAWSAGTDPVPFQIGIQEGYGGKLKLPEPYGEVTVGEPMVNRIGTLMDLRAFMLSLGAAFENKDPNTYDCEKSLTCQLNEDDSFYMLDYRRGGIYLSKTANLPIGFIYFSQPQQFFAPLVDPILHNQSIGGLTFQSRRATVETRLGPSLGFQDEAGLRFFYYDKANFAVAWDSDTSPQATPRAFKALGAYAGPQAFGGTIGTRKLGDSFASYATVDETGKALLLLMDRTLNNRPAEPAYDCSIVNGEVQPTCEAVIDTTVTPNRLLLVIDNSVYGFTHDATRTWLSVGMRKP